MDLPDWFTHPGDDERQDESNDDHETPEWVVELLFAAHPPPKGIPILEPAAGTGNICRVAKRHGYRAFGVEIKENRVGHLAAHVDCMQGDFLALVRDCPALRGRAISVVQNPPWSIGQKFWAAVHRYFHVVYCASHIAWQSACLAKYKRPFLDNPPTRAIPITGRPSYTGEGTAMSEVGWYIRVAGESALFAPAGMNDIEHYRQMR